MLAWQKRQADIAATDDEKKRAQRGYQDAVLALSKAYALASASEAAADIRDEVGFFQAVRAALVKTSTKGKLSDQGRLLANGRGNQQISATRENNRLCDNRLFDNLATPSLLQFGTQDESAPVRSLE